MRVLGMSADITYVYARRRFEKCLRLLDAQAHSSSDFLYLNPFDLWLIYFLT